MDPTILAHARLDKVTMLSIAHGIAADVASRRNKWLGVPVVVLTSIVGTSVFASLTELGKAKASIAIGTGILSLLAAVLAAVQTFFNFGETFQAHARASIRFQAIGNALQHLLVKGVKKNIEELRQLDKEITKAQEDAPRVPQSLQDLARSRFQAAAAKKHDEEWRPSPFVEEPHYSVGGSTFDGGGSAANVP